MINIYKNVFRLVYVPEDKTRNKRCWFGDAGSCSEWGNYKRFPLDIECASTPQCSLKFLELPLQGSSVRHAHWTRSILPWYIYIILYRLTYFRLIALRPDPPARPQKHPFSRIGHSEFEQVMDSRRWPEVFKVRGITFNVYIAKYSHAPKGRIQIR